MNTRLLVYRGSRVKIGSTALALGRYKDFAYKERKKYKKLSGNFGYMMRRNPYHIIS